MHLPFHVLVLLVSITLAAPLCAQNEPERAREILNGAEYKGYRIKRVEQTPGNTASRPSDDAYRGDRRGTGIDAGQTQGPSLSPEAAKTIEAVMWVLLGLVVAVALFFIVRAILDRKPNPRLKQLKEAVKEKEKPAPPPLDDITALESDLAEAIRAGDYGLAALLVFKLFWRKAGWTGFADARDVKTWRDACKQIHRADARQEVRKLLGMVERVRYGRHAPSAAEFSAWRTRLEAVEVRPPQAAGAAA